MVQGDGCSPGNATRHIGHAVVNDIIDYKSGLLVGRRSGRFKTPTLVYRHINHNATSLHTLDVLRREQFGSCGTGNKHRTNHQVRSQSVMLDSIHS